MAGATPTLGYPTRTAAVTALRRQGLTTREIANRVGIDPKTVSALECSAARNHASDGTRRPVAVDIIGGIPLNVRQLLRPHAARRALSVDQLIRELIANVAHGDLVNAVMDDVEDLS